MEKRNFGIIIVIMLGMLTVGWAGMMGHGKPRYPKNPTVCGKEYDKCKSNCNNSNDKNNTNKKTDNNSSIAQCLEECAKNYAHCRGMK